MIFNFRAKYGKIPDICKHYKATKFPPDAVLSTSEGNFHDIISKPYNQ